MKCFPNPPLLESIRWLRSNSVDATRMAKRAINLVDSMELLPQERLRAKAVWVTILTRESALFRLIKRGCRYAVSSGVGSRVSIFFKIWLGMGAITVLGATFSFGIVRWMDGAQITRILAVLPVCSSPILLSSRSAIHLLFFLSSGARRFLSPAERIDGLLCGGLAILGTVLVAVGLAQNLVQDLTAYLAADEVTRKAVGVFQSKLPGFFDEVGSWLVRLAIPLSLYFMVETRAARIVHGFLAAVGGLAALAWWSRTAWLRLLETEHSTDVLRAIVALDVTSLMASVLLVRTFFGLPVQAPREAHVEAPDEKDATGNVFL